MSYTEACPNCGSDDYTTNDYSDDFDSYEAQQRWDCICNKCGCKFTIERIYKLAKVYIEEEEE